MFVAAKAAGIAGEGMGVIHDVEPAGEAVSAGVPGCADFSPFGFGAGGEAGVGYIGQEFGEGDEEFVVSAGERIAALPEAWGRRVR